MTCKLFALFVEGWRFSARVHYYKPVCDAVALCTKAHPNNKEIQLGGCHILSIIGKNVQKQNEQRRLSVDFLEIPSSLVHRKNVTEEILEVASAAIQKLKKFKDDVLEDNDGYYSSPGEFGMELKPANITASRNSIGFDSSDLEEHLSES